MADIIFVYWRDHSWSDMGSQIEWDERKMRLGWAYRLVMTITNVRIALYVFKKWRKRKLYQRWQTMINEAMKRHHSLAEHPEKWKHHFNSDKSVTLLEQTGWRIRKAHWSSSFIIESN